MAYARFKTTAAAILTLGLLAILASSGTAGTGKPANPGGEKKITQKQIPPAVMTAFQTAYPKAVIKGSDRETENGITYYEIESINGTVKRDIQYTSDGKVVEVEESIDVATLPEAARRTISKEYPKGKVQKAERLTQGDKTKFEVVVLNGTKRSEIVFDSTGQMEKPEAAKKQKN